MESDNYLVIMWADNQGLAEFFRKGPESKYFRLHGPENKCIIEISRIMTEF
jgi:hypothetical protein